MRRVLAFTLLLGCDAEVPEPPAVGRAALSPDTPALLDEAVTLYRRGRAEALFFATDPFERLDRLVGAQVIEVLGGREDYETLFQLGDEAFEAELDRVAGVGQGAPPAAPLPARPARVHDGERGGLDSGSCRACHFSGGPDGAGAATQVALLRGDGRRLGSTTVRDAPHLMGLGYLSRVARELERELARRRDLVRADAALLGIPQTIRLDVRGIDFGRLTADPDGALDTSGVRGVSPDLVIRPFGHKGRHADLVVLCDEALQIHHGLQTTSRVAEHAAEAVARLGPGDAFDPDADGVQSEVSEAQAVLLASYLSLLPVPQVRPPADPALAFAWARGRALLDEVGCSECHRPVLRFTDDALTLRARGGFDLSITLPLLSAGQDPRPRRVDFGADPDDTLPVGTPIFAFTDLRRHDLGPALAEPVDEALPDGGGAVPGAVWLTRPLWGLADTAPYLHDGRATTVHEAILWHGGEAQAARDAYAALPAAEQGALRMFLMSLTRDPTLLVE